MVQRYLIYDLETFSNCFTAFFKDFKTGKKKAFIIHESQNDLRELMKFLRAVYANGYWLVGFNCIGFDAQILEYIFRHYRRFKKMNGDHISRELYQESQRIINLDRRDRHLHLIQEWNLTIPHLDIFKFKHYEGAQKSCSLKWLEFTMRFNNIESMPFEHYHEVLWDEIDIVLRYNENDVNATERAFELNMYEVDLRFKLSEEYNLPLMNASEPKLSREIFGHLLADKMNISYRTLKDQRTLRTRISGEEIIFPYITFRDPLLKQVHQWFKNIDFDPSPRYDENGERIKIDYPPKVFDFHNIKEATVALGGIHACIQPGIYTASDTWKILDIDGKSFYPNLGINNNLHPEHLPEKQFCELYKFMYDQRTIIPKDNPINYIYKIILNAIYGQSIEFNNLFCDPQYGFTITLNGQLLLLKLGELLKDRVKGIVFYQFNTDGVTIGYDVKEEASVKEAMALWSKVARIVLEEKFYQKMVIMDVNNYLAVDLKGKVKRKGLFGYSMDPADSEMFYHKNPSMLVVPKALEAYYVHNVPIRDYIMNSKDIFDFCIGIKKKDAFDVIEYSIGRAGTVEKKNVNAKVIRYYVSTEQSKLKKFYKRGTKKAGSYVDLESGWATKMFNVYEGKEMKDYNIDYAYYITEARKVLDKISPNATNLKLF
jgi:hypothetical protein